MSVTMGVPNYVFIMVLSGVWFHRTGHIWQCVETFWFLYLLVSSVSSGEVEYQAAWISLIRMVRLIMPAMMDWEPISISLYLYVMNLPWTLDVHSQGLIRFLHVCTDIPEPSASKSPRVVMMPQFASDTIPRLEMLQRSTCLPLGLSQDNLFSTLLPGWWSSGSTKRANIRLPFFKPCHWL